MIKKDIAGLAVIALAVLSGVSAVYAYLTTEWGWLILSLSSFLSAAGLAIKNTEEE